MDVADILLKRGLIDETQATTVRQADDIVSWATGQPGLDADEIMRAIANDLGLEFIKMSRLIPPRTRKSI